MASHLPNPADAPGKLQVSTIGQTQQKRHREHLTVQLKWSFIMGMSTEERQGHVEGNTALL
jgi:hypothetical protein